MGWFKDELFLPCKDNGDENDTKEKLLNISVVATLKKRNEWLSNIKWFKKENKNDCET